MSREHIDHSARLAWLEQAEGAVIAISSDYPDGYRVSEHSHSRAQLLHARSGVVLVTSAQGRWMVPRGHAMWIPAHVRHAVETIGDVRMHSVYVAPEGQEGLPSGLRVLGLTELMRSLIAEAVTRPSDPSPEGRAALILALLVAEIPNLHEQPLALPFPSDERLAVLCRRFVEAPSAHVTIDTWAKKAGMSRRSLTRHFAEETGLGLSTWRRQALLFAALPRLAAGEPVTRVALDLGYESVPAFTTLFRRVLGAAPRAWLRGGEVGKQPSL
jgi:AraC-like DNA-binding protein/quercetin dioxygenase-like cupin family protein